MKHLFRSLGWVLLVGASFLPAPLRAGPYRTDFPYQGRLSDAGRPAEGQFDFQARLFDAATNGAPVGEAIVRDDVAVTNGWFSLSLDFGESIATLQALWLEVGVRPSGVNSAFTVLSPRQPLTPVPLARYSAAAGSVQDGSVTSPKLALEAVGTESLQNAAVTSDKIAAGQVVKSLNGLRDDLLLQGGPSVAVTHEGKALTIGIRNEVLNPVRQVVIVRPDGRTTNYTTLREALASADYGDTVRVFAQQQVTVQRVYDGAQPELAGLYLTNRSNVTIEGVGSPVISSAQYGDYLYIRDCTNITVAGLTFSGAGPNPGEADSYAMINFGGTNKNLLVRSCRFDNYGSHGVSHLWGDKTTSFATVENCTFFNGGDGNHPTQNADGAAISGVGRGWRVVNNTIVDCLRGIEIEGVGPSQQSKIVIAHNVLEDIWNEGIMLFATSLTSSNYADILVEGNVVSGKKELPLRVEWQAGINFQGGERITIANNIVSDFPSGLVGIGLTSGHTDIRGCSVSGNIVRNISGRGIQLAAVASNKVEACIVSANQVQQCGDRGIIISGSKHLVSGNLSQGNLGAGIEVYVETGTTDRNTINNNLCYGNSTYGITIRPKVTGTVLAGNRGFDNTQGLTDAESPVEDSNGKAGTEPQ
jgi:hypothetical protein